MILAPTYIIYDGLTKKNERIPTVKIGPTIALCLCVSDTTYIGFPKPCRWEGELLSWQCFTAFTRR